MAVAAAAKAAAAVVVLHGGAFATKRAVVIGALWCLKSLKPYQKMGNYVLPAVAAASG